MNKSKTQILDIIRICAALMVFTVHFFMFVEAPSGISRITANFSSGVALFFVISGYLMMQSLEHCTSIGEYFKKRVIRIIPSYYAILVIGIFVWDMALGMMPPDELSLGWLRYFLFLNTVVPSKNYYSWNDLWGLWTFSCFMFFYLIAPLLKKIIKNYRQCLILLFITIVSGYLSGAVVQRLFNSFGYADAYIIAGDSPWFNLNVFVIGMTLWYALKENREKNFAGVCALIITALMLIEKTNRVGFGCAAAIIIIAFFNMEIKNTFVVKLIDVLGRYSFSFYLVHLAVMQLLNLAKEQGYIDNNLLFMLLIIIISAVAAVLLYNCVEKPAAEFIRKYSKHNSPKKAC